MKVLKLKKRIIACLCGLFMLFGIAGVVALQGNHDIANVTAEAATTTEICIASTPWAANNEYATASRFRILFDGSINNLADDGNIANNVSLEHLNGLQDKLLIAGKTPTEWSKLDVGFAYRSRSSSQPVFVFDKGKLNAANLNFFNDTFVVELKEDCVLNNDFGTVKAFAMYVTTATGGQVNPFLTLKQDRLEGPFYYEGVSGGLLQVKMWFANSVIAANGSSDTTINVNQMEGLENALYFNGKTIAEWAAEGALGTLTARSAGGFIFRFNTAKFDTSKAYVIELKEEVKTSKGFVQPFAYWVKPGLTFGNFFNSDGSATGNGYEYQGKEFDFSRVSFELKINNANTLKMWFTDGAKEAPLVMADNGSNLAAGVSHLEGLENVLKIDGKTIAEWETLLGDGFSIGSRASDGRLTPYFNLTTLGENNFIGKNFAVELENDYMTSQGVVKAFKYVYSWAMGEGVLNPAEEEVVYSTSGEAEMADEFFYFDVTLDKDIVKTAPAVDTPLSNDDLQKADLSNLVKVNGKDVATAMYSIAVVKDTKNTLRFSILNSEISANVEVELLAGYVFPNGNTLGEGTVLNLNVLPTDKLTLKQDRAEGPFYYEGVTSGLLQVKMWFAESVIAANDGADTAITVDQMEGLENALYFNGKSIAEWNAEGALGTLTARTSGGFIFRFDTTKFDYSKAYLIEIKEEVQTTKGLVQPFSYWVKAGLTFGNFNNSDGTPNGNGYEYQGKEFDFSRVSFELKIGNANTLKMWFTDGTNESPVVTANNGDGYSSGVSHLEGLENVLKIDGKTIVEWETLLGDGFSIGSRASDGRLTPYFSLAALAENNFIGKTFAVELENDYMTSQGVVKAFKCVYSWAMGEGVLNPTEEEVKYSSADSFHNMDEFFYFDVTFDKDVVKTAPAVDTPLSNDDLQKAALSNLVKVNGKDVATAMYSIAVVKETTNTLRFSILNTELSHNVYFELLAGYVFPNGNVLAEDITLFYNEQNGTWQTTAMPDITVVYNANGGEGEMIGSTVAYGSDYLLAENTFTNLGYEFAGWARTADGKVVFKDAENLHLYVGGALENVNSTTLNLYAVWQKERGVRFMSISMAGDIGLNFYVDLDDAEEATATITMKGESTTVVGVYQETLNCWKFTYGVAPKDYQEIVSISVADVVAEYSVAAYANALPEDNAAYPIVAELMEYCEAARVYFANEEATATEDLSADLSEYEATIEGEEENVTIAGATLVLESKTTINVYVTAESLDGITCTVDGETVTPVALEGQDGQYVISISGIVAKDLDNIYTITIGGYTITYCALSYVGETLSGTVDNVALANLVKAMYSLSVEAELYFNAAE